MNYLDLWFIKSLPWLFNRNLLTEIKRYFYRNIAILCAKMYRVNKTKARTIGKVERHLHLNKNYEHSKYKKDSGEFWQRQQLKYKVGIRPK